MKLKNMILGLVFLLAVMPLSFAQDVSDDDLVNETEAVILSSPYGAQVRLTQLENRIDVHIENANAIIEKVNEVNSSFDTSRLEEIVEEFGFLKENIENLDLNQSSDILAEEYVAIKAEVIELSKEFKDIAQSVLTEDVKAQLREQNNERVRANLEEKNEKLERFKNQYSAQKVEKLMSNLGIEDNETIEKIVNGEMNVGEARSQIVKKYSGMSKEEKKEAIERVRAEKRNEVENAKQNRAGMIENSKTKREEIRNQIEEKIKGNQDKQDTQGIQGVETGNTGKGKN